ncbi:reverse transcriptase domain-containing protein [Tanacetum coccineum]|uniref:Reverse transcriptase domain-containing protein n=1 Tax=Tanacetum coccineum TaxID=301880 RepID=A0ABQ5E0V7_9ASTR
MENYGDSWKESKAEGTGVEMSSRMHMESSGLCNGIFHPGLIKAKLHLGKNRHLPPPEREGTSEFQERLQNKQRPDRKPDRFSLLTKTPKEIFALEKGKFKAPPPMVTPVEKRDPNKYCEFHSDTGHSTDECMQRRKHIDWKCQGRKNCRIHKELNRTQRPKARKRGRSGKDKPLTILMIQMRKVAKPRITQSFSPETAMSFPPLREEEGTEGPMIIEVEMGGHFVHRVYVDGGASSEVLYEHCFIKLRKEIRDQMVPATTHLIGFSGETIWPLGQIALLVKIGDEVHSTSAWMNFMVIRSPSQHNAIIGRPGIRKIRAVPSTAHGMLKFPVEGGTVTLQSSRVIPMECAMISGPSIQPPAVSPVLEEKINIAIHPEYPEQTVAIGSTLTEKGRKELCSLLKRNLDIFAWKPADMTGVPRNIAEHRLNIREGYSPVRPIRKRGRRPERNKAIQEEVEKLVDAGIMKVVPLSQTPNTYRSKGREELIIYLAAAKEAISAVLMTDREGRQIPVYFVSRTYEAGSQRIPYGKVVLSLAQCKKTIEKIFQFELEGYDIQYRPRTAIKGQILADFIVERPEEESPDELMAEPEVLPEPWTLFTDGSSCVDGSGAGLILTNPEGAEFTYAMRFRFEATNNEAEYEALIAGLRIAEKMGIKNLQANVDSRLVANQVNGSYIAKESGMVQYLNKVKTLAKSFKEFSIKQIPRSENKKADALSKIASTSFAHLNKQVLVEELKEKSINEEEILDIVEEEGNTWMTPIQEYLTKEILPEDKKKARAVRRKAAKYAMINGTLYKKSFLGPWLRCVGPLQANYVLREIHEGSCSMHSGPRSVVAKVIQTGYYWPTMHMDARNLIRECNDCQIHRPVPRNPQQNLTPIMSPWPFYKWGIDIAGPFPEGPGKVKFLIVAIDYFTKWIEAKAVATITGNQVKKFVWDNIVCRFGLPGEIISDNGKQFRDNPFKDWCEKLCIRQCFASVKHPQANGLVERANRSLGEGIKARLDERSRDWIEELPHVLWAHRTMIKSSNGETPFSLTYGTEAVIPAEIGMPTLRTAEIDQAKNNEALGINLDLIEEKREQAAIQEAKSKKKMEKYYNSRVRGTSFKPGEMVYRSNEASHAKDGGKLGPKWEGPYEVKESLGKGAYKLKDRKGNDMPRTWNIDLERIVSLDEIKRTVWDCCTNKSTGPDGFTFEFFRRYWKVLKQDIVAAVVEFLASGFFSGIPIDNSLPISHLFFTDDDIFVVTLWELALVPKRSKLQPDLWVARLFLHLLFILELRFIKAISGESGAFNSSISLSRRSRWLEIIREVDAFQSKAINLVSCIRKK